MRGPFIIRPTSVAVTISPARGFGSSGEAPRNLWLCPIFLPARRLARANHPALRSPSRGDALTARNAIVNRSHTGLITPDRLCGAADQLLAAIHSPSGYDSFIYVHAHPSSVPGSAQADLYTTEECVEAMSMLIRLGVVPAGEPVLR